MSYPPPFGHNEQLPRFPAEVLNSWPTAAVSKPSYPPSLINTSYPCAAHYTGYSIRNTLHTILCTHYTTHYTGYSTHSTLHTILCTHFTTHYTLNTLHYTLYSVHTSLHTTLATQHTLHCTLYFEHTVQHTSISSGHFTG